MRVGLRVVGGLVAAALLASAMAAAQEKPQEAVVRHYRASVAAYQAHDFATFVAETRAIVEIVPDHPRYLYNLACGLALAGDAGGAVGVLERLAAMGLTFDVAADDDFASLRESAGFKEVAKRMEALKQPAGEAKRAFALADPRFMPEGVAYDPADGSFFVGGVHSREIARVKKDGRVERIAGREDGLDSVLGMAVDPARHLLWACSSAMPEMEGYAAADEGRAALVRIELPAGKPVRSIAIPARGGVHNCNDLTVGPSGEVYVADSVGGAIYRLPAGAQALEEWVPPGAFRSPNGLALGPGATRLYVSDYAAGLFAVDLATRSVTPLGHPDDLALRGIDGLTAVPGRPGTLLAIQNGIRPYRVLRLDLAPDGLSITGSEVLLRSHPDFDEPTLGTVVGDHLYLVANSHWNRIGADHNLPPAAELTPPIILDLALNPAGPSATTITKTE